MLIGVFQRTITVVVTCGIYPEILQPPKLLTVQLRLVAPADNALHYLSFRTPSHISMVYASVS